MKICPKCQRTYTDDNLNFCLDDGVVLQKAGGNESPETVFMKTPPTSPSSGPTSPSTPQGWNMAPQQSQSQAPKKSKAWLWVLAVLALVVMLCGGGGIVGLILLGSMTETDSNANKNVAQNKRGNVVTQGSPKTVQSPGSAPSGDSQDVDMSDWGDEVKDDVYHEYTGGEYILGTKKKRFYYVMVAKEYSTESATTKLTVRNVDNADSSLGYGLVFASSPIPLMSDYAFLIDSKKKRYRFVRHSPATETAIVNWTNSDVINPGTQENILEVRSRPGDISLYINGQFIKTVPNSNSEAGVPGIYSGDGVRIGFKNLQITK